MPRWPTALPENVAPLIQSMASGYTHLMAPATTTGKNIMPRVAALLDVMQVSDIIKVESADSFQRPDLCRQRHRHRDLERGGQGGHRAQHRFRGRRRRRWQRC